MTICLPRHLPSRAFFGRLTRDDRGVAAVEFALILPLMLTLYLGCAELSQGLIATRKSTNVAIALSDLVAEQAAGAPISPIRKSPTFSPRRPPSCRPIPRRP